MLFLYCKEASGIGGESILVDTKLILSDLYLKLGKNNAFTSHGNVIFSDFSSFFVGNIFNKDECGNYFLRFRNDKFGYFNSEISQFMDVFYDLIEKYKVIFKLEKNHGYIVNNGRFLHRRKEFEGSREMWRVLAHDNFLPIKGFSYDT